MDTRSAGAGKRDLDETDWREVARSFRLAPGLTYLNSGSEGSIPIQIQQLLAESTARWAASPSEAFFNDPDLDSLQVANRARMAAFTGADHADVVLTDNTTMGLAMVLFGLPFKAGDEIITTDQDHFSLYSPLYVLARRVGIKVVKLALPLPANSPDAIVSIFRSAITSRTRAICFSHINYAAGLRMPVRDICALARERHIVTLVDGAHALGMLGLDIPSLGADFYATAGHKWLSGPPGTGILHIRNAAANPWKLEAVFSERAMEISATLTIADALQARASLNGPALYALARTATLHEKIGKAAIEGRILALARQVERQAVDAWGEGCLFSPLQSGGYGTGLTAFVPSRNHALAYDTKRMQAIASTLAGRYGIWVLSTAIPVPNGAPAEQINTIRVSTNIFNFPDQIDTLFRLLRELAP